MALRYTPRLKDRLIEVDEPALLQEAPQRIDHTLLVGMSAPKRALPVQISGDRVVGCAPLRYRVHAAPSTMPAPGAGGSATSRRVWICSRR